MIRTQRVIRENWRKNYRYHGGVRAASRCLVGTLALRAGLLGRRRGRPAPVEILSFSVVPWMTALWARLLGHAVADRDFEILIGDCSGGLGPAHHGLMGGGVRCVPCLNKHHGEKIDLFLSRLCRAPYVVIADDDIFWLSGRPLSWALARLEADPRVAAVSLKPRAIVSSVLERDNIAQPMGSHCLVIRRELWRRERLSFAVRRPPPGTDWFYDTGDFANRELLRRGFRVVIAEPESEPHFAAFDGVSSWILKLQGQEPDRLAATVAGIPIRQKKALQAVHVARGLALLLADRGLVSEEVEIVPASRLDSARSVLRACLSTRDRGDVRRTVEATLKRIRDRLFDLEISSGGDPSLA